MWTTPALRFVVALLLWAVAAPAWATTLAVLPLERGAGSEAYDGLGKALAGMLVADLSPVEGLVLVERARLDALLSEISLGESGYLDPATAQTVGKGVGAELVLVGSWSVVEGRFLLDARVVQVEDGTVRKAVAADGTVDDFVSVEKDLVTGLVDGLDVALSASDRRRLWSTTPTERFDAFVAYSEGLQAEDQGAWEAAAAAYERAIAADPEFVAARDALSGLRGALEAAAAEAESASAATQSAALSAVLAAVPDERERERGFVHDDASRAGFALRSMALENAGRHCQRYEEMLAFAEHTDWHVELPREAYAPFDDLVDATGFVRVPRDVEAPKAAYDSPRSRLEVFENLREFVAGEFFTRLDEASGVAAAAVWCFPPPERVQAIDRIRESLEASSRAGEMPRAAIMTPAEELILIAEYQRAVHLGPNATMESRLQALLDAHMDDTSRSQVRTQIEVITRMAGQWEDHRVRQHGRTHEELERVQRGLATQDPEVLALDDPTCRTVAGPLRSGAAHWVARLPEVVDDEILGPQAWDRAGMDFAVAATLGCVKGVPARFEDTEALASFLRAGLANVDPEDKARSECASSISMLESFLQPSSLEQARVSPQGEAMWAYGVMTIWYGTLLYGRCVEDRVP